jgi:Zn-dependent peptidase ImmA (M78 family)
MLYLSMPSIEVPVQPKVLIWARESIGKGIEEAAKKLDMTPEEFLEFETGTKKPRLTQLEKLANLYKRPVAALLLSKPPPLPPLPKDFRTLPYKKPFSSETLLALRRARRLQNLADELAKELNYEIRRNFTEVKLPEREKISDTAETLAIEERTRLGINIEDQFNWKDNIQALDEWRSVIERLGVLVFQLRMPVDETRGFTLTEGSFPIIVINGKDSHNGRIFTLFHEYCHLMLHDTGVCGEMMKSDLEIEIFCNHYAGAFLVPGDSLLKHELIQPFKGSIEWPDDILDKLSKDFKVSNPVILRRLLELKRTTKDFYVKKLEEWRPHKSGGGGRDMARECLRNNGGTFVSLVLNAYGRERITPADVADYLGTRLQHIPEIERLMKTVD